MVASRAISEPTNFLCVLKPRLDPSQRVLTTKTGSPTQMFRSKILRPSPAPNACTVPKAHLEIPNILGFACHGVILRPRSSRLLYGSVIASLAAPVVSLILKESCIHPAHRRLGGGCCRVGFPTEVRAVKSFLNRATRIQNRASWEN